MAYLAFFEGTAGLPVELTPAAPEAAVVAPVADTAPARFSPLDWQVIALAERDTKGSLRRPGPLATALGNLFGTGRNPRLADPQLEALRRIAVLSWHHGYVVPPHEVRAFTDAGYSLDQYELLMDSIAEARVARRQAA
jgi:hypothetical protein